MLSFFHNNIAAVKTSHTSSVSDENDMVRHDKKIAAITPY